MAAVASKMKRMDDLIADLDQSLSEFAQGYQEHYGEGGDDGFDLLDSYNDDTNSVNTAVVGAELLRLQSAPPSILSPIDSVTMPAPPIHATANAWHAVGGTPMPLHAVEFSETEHSGDRDFSFHRGASLGAVGGNGTPGIAMVSGAPMPGSIASAGDAANADGTISALRLELERAKLELIDQLQMNKVLLQGASAAAAGGLYTTPAAVPSSGFRASTTAARAPSRAELIGASVEVESINSDSKSEARSDSKSDKSGKSSGWFGGRTKNTDNEAKAKRREEKRAIEMKKKEVINVPMMM
ncbi:hypothetical protein HDU84_003757 [Entophlyctis sp. JEL0112]|nr:hypothetical protein HDU84_003757 [Entophlyctis sp. JEL0112]